MKPTNDIIDELRKEAAHPPCPRRVSNLLTEAADRLDHLFASGIHTCHADCQRPMCVLRRERDKALAELERVTAERDRWVHDYSEKYDETRDLRARVADLEADASLHWITEEELRQSRARVADLEHQLKSEIEARNGWWDNCNQAERRNAELEAVLRDAQEVLNEYAEDGTHRAARLASERIDAALASAESATSAKFDFAAHDAAFVEWWSREGSGFHPAAIEDREEFTRRIANLAWIISANAARKQEGAR